MCCCIQACPQSQRHSRHTAGRHPAMLHMPLCVTALMLFIRASFGSRETVAVQACTAASHKPTWDRSQAQKRSPGSMTSGRAYPGRVSPCTHCEAYDMQQRPNCSTDSNSRPGRLGQGHPLHPIARMLSVAATHAVALCQLGGISAQLVCGPFWPLCKCDVLTVQLTAFESVHLIVGHVSVDYREYAGNFGRIRSAFWPMQSRITGFAFP